jgi:hypothetical protein
MTGGSLAYYRYPQAMVRDGLGGVIVSWAQTGATDIDLFAQHIKGALPVAASFGVEP